MFVTKWNLLLVLSVVSIANMGILEFWFAFLQICSQNKGTTTFRNDCRCRNVVLHNVIGAIGYFSHDMIFSHSIFPYMLGVGMFELAGLIIFLKITLD